MFNSTVNCTTPSDESVLIVRIIQIGVSVVTFIACMFVVVLMVVYKKYVFTIPRLILYLTITVLINNLVHVLEGIGGFHVLIRNDSYCIAMALLREYTGLCILLSIFCFMIELTVRVMYLKSIKWMEWLYVPSIFLLPATISWIPLATRSYGMGFYFCDVIFVNRSDCQTDTTGIIVMIGVWWVPLYSTCIIAGIMYIYISWKLKRSSRKYTAIIDINRDMVYQNIISEVSYLKWYPLLFIFVNILPLISLVIYFFRYYGPHIAVAIISTIFNGFEGCALALMVALDPNTRKRLKWKDLKAAFIQNILCREPVEEYPILTGDHITDSLIT
jgi:hypothetical protein